jgi:hypothetical protein
MAGSRTLKLSILAETKDLVDGLGKATKSTETFGDKATEFGKKAALAFAVAGTAALAFAADAVKAAAQDQAAQEKLAETIKATTGATAAQVAGVENYITKTSIAIGVTDDQLRPAFSRLVRSTQDVEEAQRLLNLALDLSVATGKPVETIANALGRAYDGNTTALARLGLGLDANLIKSKDNEAIITSLETTYGRFAEGAAETAAVKFERIRIATDEAKESIGAALLPVVEQLMDYVIETVVPNLETFINALTGKGSLAEATDDGREGAYKFGEEVRKVLKIIINLKDELMIVGGVIAGLFVVSKISAAVMATIATIRSLITVYNALKASAIVAGVASYFALNPLAGVAAVAIAAAVLAGATALAGRSDVDTTNLGIPSTGSIPFSTGFAPAPAPKSTVTTIPTIPKVTGATTGVTTAAKVAASAATASNVVAGSFNAGSFRAAEAASGTTINLTVTGAFDKEGTARTIVNTLNDSFYRGTGGGTNLQMT